MSKITHVRGRFTGSLRERDILQSVKRNVGECENTFIVLCNFVDFLPYYCCIKYIEHSKYGYVRSGNKVRHNAVISDVKYRNKFFQLFA